MPESYLYTTLYTMLTNSIVVPQHTSTITSAVIILIIVLLAVVSDYVTKWFIEKPLKKIVQKTKTDWDDILYDKGVPARIAHIVPAIVVYVMLPMAISTDMYIYSLLSRISIVYIVAVVIHAVSGFISASEDIANRNKHLKNRPLKGLFQTIHIIAMLIGLLIMIAVMANKSPLSLLAGLGASAAVLSFVFKDSLISLISGFQLSWNDMLRPGDWIEIPSKNISGVVFEITLNTVKVRNFDNTILTIPPLFLMNDAFQNWRGMAESPGRRAKRTINIDMNSVKFVSEEEFEALLTDSTLSKYLSDQTQTHKDLGTVTNLKLLRVYMQRYMRQLSGIAPTQTLMVRYLQATSEGLPLELYFFSADKKWENYETFAADVVDHLIAILPKFGLKIYQKISNINHIKE